MLTIACVNAGNYLGRGETYVRALYEGVLRNYHGTPFFKFVCFTDQPHAVYEHIDYRPLPQPGLKGWFNKIALFKPGVFADGERILYLDLDTIVCGSLDEIAAYDGTFALLEDVIFPGQWGSGVMAWRGGFGAHIYQQFIAAGCPDVKGGDQVWLARTVKQADILQDLYPNQIASYKMSGGVLSPFTRLVAFHGLPRPHSITTGWVPALWHPQQKDTA